MAQGSAAALCGLVFGPTILMLLATAVERDYAAWRIERRRFGTVSEYVAMRWLGHGLHGRQRIRATVRASRSFRFRSVSAELRRIFRVAQHRPQLEKPKRADFQAPVYTSGSRELFKNINYRQVLQNSNAGTRIRVQIRLPIDKQHTQHYA